MSTYHIYTGKDSNLYVNKEMFVNIRNGSCKCGEVNVFPPFGEDQLPHAP